MALSLRPLTLNTPFVARLVKNRSDDSFLEGIPVRRMAGLAARSLWAGSDLE
jgi:hypothetical protein